MNVVTFETAKRLKEAGFPQPKFYNSWQYYYTISGLLIVPGGGSPALVSETLAPSSTDILKKLGGICELSFRNTLSQWQVSWVQNQFNTEYFNHDNPAEACAAAWLAKNEKP